ncbi:MAG TPA: hypothetical protein VJ873_13850, partial [bacterium]|nr:hypothetical protein [bacterium]
MKSKKPKQAKFSSARIFQWLVAVGLGLLGLWQFHNVEFYSHFDLVPGGRGDNRLVTALLEYFYHALKGEGPFRSPAFYYPAQGTLGYADVFLNYAIPYGVLRSAGWDVFSCYQACGLLFSVLNYACAFLLPYRGLRQGVVASALGAFLFAFNAPKFNQMSHPQLQCLFLLPLVVWVVVEWVKRNKKLPKGEAFGFLALAALLADFQFYSGFYAAWFFLFWALLFLALCLCLKAARVFLKELWGRNKFPLLGAAGIFTLGLIPFLWIYLPVIHDLGGRDYSEVQMMIPDPWAFLWMGPRHSWWGWLWDHCQAIRNYPVEGEERDGLGIAVLTAWVLLTLAAGWSFKKKKVLPLGVSNPTYESFAKAMVLATALFVLLSLKYPGDISPWRIIFEIVPGGGSIRAVSRYVIVLALPLSMALAFTFQALWERIQKMPKTPARLGLGGL